MNDLDQFTPAQQEQLLSLMRRHNAQNAEVKTATSAPSNGCLIGRVGRCSAWLVNCGFGALSVLLLQSDLQQAGRDWMPTVISAGEALASCLDDHTHRTANPDQQFAALPTFPPIGPTGSGNVVVTPNPARLQLTTYAPSVVISQGPPGGISLEGHATIRVGGSGTLS